MNIKITIIVFLGYVLVFTVITLSFKIYYERDYKRFVRKEKERLRKSIQVIIESL